MSASKTKTLLVLCLIFYTLFLHPNQNGIIYIERHLGLLGNQLYQFCLGKILSTELNYPLHCPPIYGFPETYKYNTPPQLNNNMPTEELNGHVINLKSILSNKTPRIISLKGIFSRYEYYKKYTAQIKQWLKFETPIKRQINPNDIVMHVRINREQHHYMDLPPSYYEKALSITTFDKLYICTNEPKDPYLNHFQKYNPIITSGLSLRELMNQGKSYDEIMKLNLEEFKFIMSFNKIITAQSTFSWWAAFLSEATEIYAPLPNKGIMSPERPDIQMTGIEEERYTYIQCDI